MFPKSFASAFETYAVSGPPIGSGGSGTVFPVNDSEGRRLAIKVLDTSRTPKSKVKRFKNEIQFCSRPVSNHIVRVLDYGTSRKHLIFYVMPLYDETLRVRLKTGIPTPDVLPFFNQILDGVDAAHLCGVCHRDIKPENILHDTRTKDVVVADFGIARFKEDDLATAVNTDPDERLANFRYAAPEQRQFDAGAVDHRADIYALGLLLNEMYTSHVPQGTGFRTIAEVAPEFGYLDGLVELMIQQQPENRPQSITLVKQELVGRGHEFVRFQHLDQLRKTVVRETEIDDPLIANPIHIVEKESFRNGNLFLRLNRAINPKWEKCFRKRATAFTTTFSAMRVSFQKDRMTIVVDEYHAQQAVNMTKDYLNLANDEYAAQIRQEHEEEGKRRRLALQNNISQEEATIRLLQKLEI